MKGRERTNVLMSKCGKKVVQPVYFLHQSKSAPKTPTLI